MNNGLRIPFYMIDDDGNTDLNNIDMYELPGWDSYIATEPVVDLTYNAVSNANGEFNLGSLFDSSLFDIRIVINEGSTVSQRLNQTLDASTTEVTLDTDTASNTTTITPAISVGLVDGDRVRIFLQSKSTVLVRAGIIRAFGDLLVAGNLTETNGAGMVIRRLPGVIRTSDIAPLGTIPQNWNPFYTGTGTADEFFLSSTGIVQEMVPLQGYMVIYTNTSIHILQPTNNPAVPFSIQNVTYEYGCQTFGAVREFDGKHLVIGSNDIYLFGGHPGSIQSIAEGRVRDYFFSNINPETQETMFTLRIVAKNEIWVCYPKGTSAFPNEALIWNYRENTWAIRNISEMRSGDVAPIRVASGLNPNQIRPLFAAGNAVYYGDVDGIFADHTGAAYTSSFDKDRLALTPEFDVEGINSVALWSNGEATLTVNISSTNTPSAITEQDAKDYTFQVGGTNPDYKTDVRIKGRFLNFTISDGTSTTTSWNVSGAQLKVVKGGRR